MVETPRRAFRQWRDSWIPIYARSGSKSERNQEENDNQPINQSIKCLGDQAGFSRNEINLRCHWRKSLGPFVYFRFTFTPLCLSLYFAKLRTGWPLFSLLFCVLDSVRAWDIRPGSLFIFLSIDRSLSRFITVRSRVYVVKKI